MNTLQKNGPAVVAYVITSLDVGGAERQLYYLLSRLNREYFCPRVITYFPGFWYKYIEDLGVPVILIDYRAGRFHALWQTWQTLTRMKPDIVHTIGVTASMLGRIAGILANVPVLISSERTAPGAVGRAYLLRQLILGLFTDLIITNAEHSARYYIQHRIIAPEKVSIVRNAIDVSNYPMACGSSSENYPVVGYVANFRSMKNHVFLVEAAARLIEDFPNACFLFAGEGPEQKKVEASITKLGLDRHFELYDQVKDISQFLKSLDIYTHVSEYEGMPNALMEAMACGLPCVVTNTTGNAELVQDGLTGLLVGLRDVEGLTKALIRLANDVNFAKKIGRAARQWITANLNIDIFLEQMMYLYYQQMIEH